MSWQQAAAEVLNLLPNRIHEVMDPYVAATPDRTALTDDNTTLTYRELDRVVGSAADALRVLGIRAGDRMMIVSENSIPLACLLLAASRLDAWAIVANPRLSPDGRLLFGGRTSFAPVSVQTARDRLYAAMIGIYPQPAGVRVSHAWTGNVGFTFDQLPHLTRSDGITYAMGYCCSGVALGSWLGTLAAEWIARGTRPAFSDLRFPRLPFYRGHPWFLPLVGVYYSLLDRL